MDRCRATWWVLQHCVRSSLAYRRARRMVVMHAADVGRLFWRVREPERIACVPLPCLRLLRGIWSH